MNENESSDNQIKPESPSLPRQITADAGMLQWILSSTQDQIRFADSKAAFVLLIHTFLFGFVASQMDTFWRQLPPCFSWILLLVLVGYISGSLVSITFAIVAVIPKFGEGAPRCKIFFGHIVSTYAKNYEAYRLDVGKTSQEDWCGDLSSQIVENSNIALTKHRRAGLSARWALVALFFAFSALFVRLLADGLAA